MPRKPITQLALIQEMGSRLNTPFGAVEYIKIRRYDGKPMTWREVWEVFADAYPGCWAIEVFPPQWYLVDDANIYHLFIVPEELGPSDLNIHPWGHDDLSPITHL